MNLYQEIRVLLEQIWQQRHRHKKQSNRENRLQPPLALSAFMEAQRTYNLVFPEEYREFTTKVTAGSTASFFRVPACMHLLASNTPHIGDLYQPCLLHPEKSYEDYPDTYDMLHGILPIIDLGCGMLYGMPINGPYTGCVFFINTNLYECRLVALSDKGIPAHVQREDSENIDLPSFGMWLKAYVLHLRQTT